jgi:hypothetical protein
MQNSNQTNCQEPEFQVEGNIVYLTESRRHSGVEQIKHSKPFVVDRKGRQWKIRTTSLDEDPHYEEMGCDGMRIYELHQFDGNALRQKLGDRNNAYTAHGWVRHGGFPVGLDLDLIYPLWLAYCSSDYFASLKDDRIVSPAFLLDNHSSTRSIPFNLPLPAKWKLNGSSFVSKVDWYSEGKEFGFSGENGDTLQIQTYPPPYDAGYLYATFETTDWIDFSGVRLPGGFALKAFFPNRIQSLPDPTQGEFSVAYAIDAKAKAVKPLKDFSCLPELTKKTLIDDSRYPEDPGSRRPLCYGSSSSWLTEEEIDAKLTSKEPWHRI